MKRTHDNIRDSLQKNHDEYSPRGMFSNDGIHLARARNWNPSAASSLLDKNMMRKHDEYSPKGIFSNDGIHLAQNRNPSASSLLDINMMRKNDIRDGLHKNHDEYSSKGIFSNDGIHLAQNRNPYASSLPDKNMIHSGGIILSKSPSMSIIQQKWQQMVWVRYNRTQLLFFSSMDDCESWIGKVSITEEQRLNLVAMKINFFREYSESDVELFYATKIKLEQLGPYNLHQFKLGKWATEGVITGPRVVADFGSIDENETELIREAIQLCILAGPGENIAEAQATQVKPIQRSLL
eukprot:CAMPEP_0194271236 /NCGR_PEP_ID=MMETSP0169-20130528/5072_1 /TAXON_ID=218684 /ORGANISM="Corethron pennatum, Strain L29A3" /LENGTH=293 /DNA_ID=CAMNT_0039013541 /DNA_START=567 /DNA_END=1448 /DNA_ORIENTATION=+